MPQVFFGTTYFIPREIEMGDQDDDDDDQHPLRPN
jgi:hypothetical protein